MFISLCFWEEVFRLLKNVDIQKKKTGILSVYKQKENILFEFSLILSGDIDQLIAIFSFCVLLSEWCWWFNFLVIISEDHGTKLYLIVIIVVVIVVLCCAGAVAFYCCYWRNHRNNCSSHSKKRSTEGEPEVATRQFSAVSQSSEPTAPPQEHVMLHDSQMVAPPTYEESRYHPISPSTYWYIYLDTA